jgi:SAM-dependent methyltransferase
VFDERDTAAAADYAGIRDQLRPLLADAEWRAAAASTLNAHYTDARIASACWQALHRLGFTGGRVLEPGCGSGNFLGLIPDPIRDTTRFVGVEVDPVTAAVAAHLYPAAEIRAEGFETSRLRSGEFDATIGNVPFGNYVLHDPVHNPQRHAIHNHFLIKAVHLTKPGGVLVALTSTWTLDARNPAARRDLHELADLLGAVRLPTGAHRHAAGTDVVTDLLILRRRRPDEQPWPFDWEYSSEAAAEDGAVRINQYFDRNPHRVLGTLGTGGAHAATSLTVTPTSRQADAWMTDLGEQLAQITAQAQQRGREWHPAPPQPPQRVRIRSTAGLEVGSLALPEGIAGPLVQLDADGQQQPVRAANKREGREIQALVEIRELATRVLDAQSDPSAEPGAWTDAQTQLNQAYDLYRGMYGRINDARVIPDGHDPETGEPTTRRELRVPRRIRRDPAWPLLAALETVDPETGRIDKAAIFTQRVVAPHRTPAGADTAAEALSICLAERGHADLDQIAHLLGVDHQTARAELGELVFDDPADGGLVAAEQYLSGDVRTKLAVARQASDTDTRYTGNVAALEAVLPPDLEPGEIRAHLGASWIPAETIAQFTRELVGDERAEVHHSPLTASWKVESPAQHTGSVAATKEWGTNRVDAYELLDDALNQRPTIVYDTLHDGRRVRNDAATIAAQDRRAAIADRFAAWTWEDHDRAEALARLYNEAFNRIVVPAYSGAHLTLPGLSATFTPHEHQRDAVWRIVCGGGPDGNVLLAHAVGAGKTATQIMAAMEMRRLGLVNKPLFVVPNHMLDQFGREVLQLYPAARVLLAGKEDLARGARQHFAARCATGTWDAVIMTHASFTRLPLSPDIEQRFLQRDLDAYQDALHEAKEARGSRFTVKELQKSVKRLEARLNSLIDRPKDTDAIVGFERLGVD